VWTVDRRTKNPTMSALQRSENPFLLHNSKDGNFILFVDSQENRAASCILTKSARTDLDLGRVACHKGTDSTGEDSDFSLDIHIQRGANLEE
jgi:hypothetical protein